jgi:hypothetical protein
LEVRPSDDIGYRELASKIASRPRAAAEPTAEATARVLARELAAATTSGAGLAKSQFKVFDPGGGV